MGPGAGGAVRRAGRMPAGDPTHGGRFRRHRRRAGDREHGRPSRRRCSAMGCRKPGDAKIHLRHRALCTGHRGRQAAEGSEVRMLPTIAWKLGNAPVTYAIDGGVYNAASAVNWARELGLSRTSPRSMPSTAPRSSAASRSYLRSPALAVPIGTVARPVCGWGWGWRRPSAISCNRCWRAWRSARAQVIEAMNRLQPIAPKLSIDGGLANNGYFRAFLAKALNRTLTVPTSMELTGQGLRPLRPDRRRAGDHRQPAAGSAAASQHRARKTARSGPAAEVRGGRGSKPELAMTVPRRHPGARRRDPRLGSVKKERRGSRDQVPG